MQLFGQGLRVAFFENSRNRQEVLKLFRKIMQPFLLWSWTTKYSFSSSYFVGFKLFKVNRWHFLMRPMWYESHALVPVTNVDVLSHDISPLTQFRTLSAINWFYSASMHVSHHSLDRFAKIHNGFDQPVDEKHLHSTIQLKWVCFRVQIFSTNCTIHTSLAKKIQTTFLWKYSLQKMFRWYFPLRDSMLFKNTKLGE